MTSSSPEKSATISDANASTRSEISSAEYKVFIIGSILKLDTNLLFFLIIHNEQFRTFRNLRNSDYSLPVLRCCIRYSILIAR